MKVLFSFLLILASVSANASDGSAAHSSLIRESLGTRTEVGLFLGNKQPGCMGCAAVSVSVHQMIVPGATQISRVVINYRGHQTTLDSFHQVGGELFNLPVSDEPFQLSMPTGSRDPQVELTFFSRNCLNPSGGGCSQYREVGTIQVSARELMQLTPIANERAVRLMRRQVR